MERLARYFIEQPPSYVAFFGRDGANIAEEAAVGPGAWL